METSKRQTYTENNQTALQTEGYAYPAIIEFFNGGRNGQTKCNGFNTL